MTIKVYYYLKKTIKTIQAQHLFKRKYILFNFKIFSFLKNKPRKDY